MSPISRIKGLPRRVLGTVARRLLSMAALEPAHLKAFLRRPPQVNGGEKSRRYPWPRRRHFGQPEKRAALRVFERERVSGNAIIYGGPEETGYCEEFTRYMGGGYADAVNSGTNAVYVALRCLDLEPFTEVIVPPITDPGGCMPVALLNCVPVPADSAPGSLNCSAAEIEAVLTERTSAIIVAHLAGHPVDLDPILKLARSRAIPVIEDCAQAHGARYKGRLVGSFGDVAAFSTMYGKHHATGAQGGVVYTRDPALFIRAKQVADRGKPFGAINNPGYLTASLNFNQDEISMAIGRVQLARLSQSLVRRRRFAAAVLEAIAGIPGISMDADRPGFESAWWFLLFRLDPERISTSATTFATALQAEGIEGVSLGYPFFPTDHPWYRDRVVFGKSGLPWSQTSRPDLGREPFALPNARAANTNCVRVDVHENLGEGEAHDLASALRKLSGHFSVTHA